MDKIVAFDSRQLGAFLRQVMGKEDLKKLLGWTAVMALVYVIALTPPLILGQIINVVTSAGDKELLFSYTALMALMVIVEAFLRLAAKPALAKLTLGAAHGAKVAAFRAIISNPVEWHQRELSGARVARLTAGGSSVDRLLDQLHSNVLPVSVTFLCAVGSFLFVDIGYALYAMAFVACFWTIQIYFSTKEKKLTLEMRIASEGASGTYTETSGNIQTIKALQLEEGITRKVMGREDALKEVSVRQKRLAFTKYFYFRLFDAFVYAGFVLMVALDTLAGTLLPGTFIVLITYFRSLDNATRETISFMDSLRENWISVGRLADLLRDCSIEEAGKVDFPECWDFIELTGARMTYSDGRPGIRDVNLKIRRGERLAIIGVSGSGKSTFAKVLAGSLPLETGSYSIGRVPFPEMNRSTRAGKIAIVLQDTELFNMSLRDNVSALREISDETILNALRSVGLEHLAHTPMGLDRMVGEKGVNLSGGERQRLGIARSICMDPDILILDEATSALDVATEQEVVANLLEGQSDKTIVFITHRLSTIVNMDRIILFEDGEIAREGRPEVILPIAERLLREANVIGELPLNARVCQQR